MSQLSEKKADTVRLAGQLTALISKDPFRLEILKIVSQLNLPDCWVAAGFVRNLVWDHLHGTTTPLSDIDVIYYCTKNRSPHADLAIEKKLNQSHVKALWSVKNQARMHSRNGDLPYQNCLHAMSYWPEKQTAIAVRLDSNCEIELLHCFGLDELYSRKITHNPKREKAIFEQRVLDKGWLKTWSQLSVN